MILAKSSLIVDRWQDITSSAICGSNKLFHPKEHIYALAFPAMETRRNNVVFTFQMKWLCYSRLSLLATAKWFLTTWLVLWKIPHAVLVRYAVTIPNQPCSLFVVCFNLFQPTTVSIGADIRGSERKIVVSRPPLSEIPRVPFESFALGFCLAFSSHRPNLI